MTVGVGVVVSFDGDDDDDVEVSVVDEDESDEVVVGITRFNVSAIERKAFNVGLPYCSWSDGDGFVNSEIISVAACLRKSDEESWGKGML